jgi:aminoglycoside 2'-N-acetyltransferase I
VTLAAARELMDEAFGGEFGDADWEHALGGLHAVVHDG